MALPVTTLVPFNDLSQLPACAAACGHLYDANGACVPPAVPQNQPAAYTSCFCADPRLAPFSSTTAGVCDNACTADPNGLNSITAWFHKICDISSTPTKPQASSTTSGSSTAKGGGSTGTPAKNLGPGGSWISGHWQWVIMLVILVVAIAGIWIGAAIWRRRYLRKRDLQAAHASSATPSESWTRPPNDSASGIPMTYNSSKADVVSSSPSFFSSEKRKTNGRKWFR